LGPKAVLRVWRKENFVCAGNQTTLLGSITTVVRVVVIVALLIVVLIVEYTSTTNNTWKICVLIEVTITPNYDKLHAYGCGFNETQ